jgi:NAD(P)-dependent dehydrogenase (short-subunit alcohol dehydrogenase family)
MVQEVIKELGSLDIAINNAGINRNHAAEECSEDDWDVTFNLNTKATFLCCQAEGRHMLKQGVLVRAPPWLAHTYVYSPCVLAFDANVEGSCQHHPIAFEGGCMLTEAMLTAVAMLTGRGKIINTASMASLLVPHPQKQIAYNASKSAVVKMTQTLGCEWAERGVNVNCISPGIVNTKLISVRTSTIESLKA